MLILFYLCSFVCLFDWLIDWLLLCYFFYTFCVYFFMYFLPQMEYTRVRKSLLWYLSAALQAIWLYLSSCLQIPTINFIYWKATPPTGPKITNYKRIRKKEFVYSNFWGSLLKRKKERERKNIRKRNEKKKGGKKETKKQRK